MQTFHAPLGFTPKNADYLNMNKGEKGQYKTKHEYE